MKDLCKFSEYTFIRSWLGDLFLGANIFNRQLMSSVLISCVQNVSSKAFNIGICGRVFCWLFTLSEPAGGNTGGRITSIVWLRPSTDQSRNETFRPCRPFAGGFKGWHLSGFSIQKQAVGERYRKTFHPAHRTVHKSWIYSGTLSNSTILGVWDARDWV